MKLKNLLVTGALAASAFASIPAQASMIPGTIPGVAVNEFYNTYGAAMGWAATPGIDGYFGAQLYLTSTATVTIQVFGSETAFINGFRFDGNPIDWRGGNNTTGGLFGNPVTNTPLATYTNVGVAAGLLDFSFLANLGAQTVNNGSNPNNLLNAPNVFMSFSDTFNTSGNSVWLFLDDGSGPNKDDDNHDDYIVRISATGLYIPEPATLSLLGLGLMGLGLARRKRA